MDIDATDAEMTHSSQGADTSKGTGGPQWHSEGGDAVTKDSSPGTTSSVDGEDEDSDEDSNVTMDDDECCTAAAKHKDAGNVALTASKLHEALTEYKNGLKLLKRFSCRPPSAAATDSSGKAMEVKKPLLLNVAFVNMKLSRWREAEANCSAALSIEPTNLKGLYRRGICRARTGNCTLAKEDLLVVCRKEPNNVEARQELQNVKEALAREAEQAKKGYGGIFAEDSSGPGLYADRVSAQAKRQKESEEIRAKEEVEWKAEMAGKEAEDVVEFEKWREAKNAKAEPAPKPSVPKSDQRPTPPPKSSSSKSEDDMDEEDKKIIAETKSRGYCYFKRDLTEEEKRQRALHVPKKIESPTAATQSSSTSPSRLVGRSPTNTVNTSSAASKKSSALSSWNAAGTTWEEKEISAIAKSDLSERLTQIAVTHNPMDTSNPTDCLAHLKGLLAELNPSGNSSAGKLPSMETLGKLGSALIPAEGKISKVVSADGEASLAVVRGSKRFLFDFDVKVQWEIKVNEFCPGGNLMSRMPGMPGMPDDKGKSTTYIGEMHLPDVTSARTEGFNVADNATVRFTSPGRAEPQHAAAVDKMIANLKVAVSEKVKEFEKSYLCS